MDLIPHPWSTLITILDVGRFPLSEGIAFIQEQHSSSCEEFVQYLGKVAFVNSTGEPKRITNMAALPINIQRNLVTLISHVHFKFPNSSLHNLITNYTPDVLDESLKALCRSLLFQVSHTNPKHLSSFDIIFNSHDYNQIKEIILSSNKEKTFDVVPPTAFVPAPIESPVVEDEFTRLTKRFKTESVPFTISIKQDYSPPTPESQVVVESQSTSNVLDPETEAKATVLKRLLPTINKDSVPPEFSLLQEVSQFELLFHFLSLSTLEDEVLLHICNHVIALEFTFHRCVSFFRNSLFPKVNALQQPASRLLFTTIVNCAKKYPKPIVFGLLLPLIEDPIMGLSQVEVVNRVLKDSLQPEMALLFLKGLLRVHDSSMPMDDNTIDFSKKIPFTESTIRILKEFFNLKAQLTSDIIESLVSQLENQADTFANNLIFTTVLFNLINKYEQQLSPHVEALKRTLNKNTTYMKNPALQKLNKIHV